VFLPIHLESYLFNVRVHLTGRRCSMQMASVFSFSLLRFVVRGFSEKRVCLLTMCLALLLFQGCAMLQRPSDIAAPTETTTEPPPSQPVLPQPTAKKSPPVQATLPQTGQASWYGPQHQGKQTASGTTYDQAALTAAHRSLPFGSKVKVTNLANGKSVEVEINDRGPFTENRIIDLSEAAAKTLGMIESGTANVRLELPSGQ
jgi:rare lipoprotein A